MPSFLLAGLAADEAGAAAAVEAAVVGAALLVVLVAAAVFVGAAFGLAPAPAPAPASALAASVSISTFRFFCGRCLSPDGWAEDDGAPDTAVASASAGRFSPATGDVVVFFSSALVMDLAGAAAGAFPTSAAVCWAGALAAGLAAVFVAVVGAASDAAVLAGGGGGGGGGGTMLLSTFSFFLLGEAAAAAAATLLPPSPKDAIGWIDPASGRATASSFLGLDLFGFFSAQCRLLRT